MKEIHTVINEYFFAKNSSLVTSRHKRLTDRLIMCDELKTQLITQRHTIRALAFLNLVDFKKFFSLLKLALAKLITIIG